MLIRFERMRGKAALWLPGTDHAGIATQMVVERQLAEDGNIGRRDMGREAFVERVWEWKAESGGTIVRQLRRLGASCDWSRERFTLDEGLSAAVRKVFVTLHKQGLIYRDKRLVNWDPQFQTAISDLEVEQREVDGALLALRLSARGRLRRDRRGHHPARDHARRHRRGRAPRRRALHATWSARCVRLPIVGRPHPDHRRRLRRSGEGLRRGEDHARRTTSTTSRSASGTACR